MLAAGRDVFAERGYHAASVASIGERAEIAKSVLYHHFGSKAQLYEAVLAAETKDLIERVEAAVTDVAKDDRLRAGMDAYLEHLERHPDAWRLLLHDRPADVEAAAIYDRLQAERAAMLAPLLSSPPEPGAPGKDDHVGLVIAGIRAFCGWWYEHRDVPRERILDAILSFNAISAHERLSAE